MVTVGVCILPEFSWREARPRWEAAEQGGFAAAWTYDHLSWQPLRTGSWFSALPLLSAVSAVTTRIRLGALVLTPNFRHPVPLAKELITLDDLSAGRLNVGLGAGTETEDATVFGHALWSRAERTARFAEFITLLDTLLQGSVVTHGGRYYAAHQARMIPGCRQQPRAPFMVAAGGPRTLILAARLGDALVTAGPWGSDETTPSDQWLNGLAQQRDVVDRECRRQGRDPSTLRRVVFVPLGLRWAQSSVGAWEEFVGRLDDVGIDEVVIHWPRPWDRNLSGPTEAVLEYAAR